MFNAIAPWYDFLNHFLSLGIDRRWRRRTAREVLAETTPPGPVLDVCCGTADLTLEMIRRQDRFDAPRDFMGLDFSEEMLEIGRRKCERQIKRPLRNVGQVRLEAGDALALPFEMDRFAVVTVAFGLRNVAQTQQGVAEMIRVCRPGGTVAILEFSMPTFPVIAGLYRFYFRQVLPRLGQWFSRSGDDAYRYLPESVASFVTPEELCRELRERGLVEVRSLPMTFGIATLTMGRVPESDKAV